jgi:hypothetical protein
MEPEGDYGPIEDALKKLAVGSTRVLDARLREDANSFGEDAIFVELALTNPSDDVTRRVEEIWELRRRVRDVMTEYREHRPPELPWYIAYTSEDPGEFAPEDTEEQISL